MPTPQSETSAEVKELFDKPESGDAAVAAPPDFEKMKVVELKEFANANLAANLVDDAIKLKKTELIEFLKAAFPNPDALDTPEVTGYDPGDPIHQTVAEVQALDGEKAAIEYVFKLADVNEFNFFKMGGALAEMLANGWMGEYDDFGAFVEGEFGFKLRKAQNLISIYHAIVSCGATWEEVKGIGWSKLSVVATVLTNENYQQWFEKIADATYASVQEMVKDSQENGDPGQSTDAGAESTPKKTMKFVVHEDQVETILTALKKAKEAGGTEYDGPALEWICLDYLGGSGGAVATTDETQPEAKAVDSEAAMTGMIRKLIKDEDEPLDALVVAVDAFETAFGDVYPEIEFDVFTDGKPDVDDLADDDTAETADADGE